LKKKMLIGLIIMTLVFGSLIIVPSFCENVEAEEAISPGPKPGSGDGVPDGNQFIQPETTGKGPAPNSGDGVPDGSGF
jgi:hypothetical protein